ncbi:hypothetical protein PORCRE_1005 [Porphyromonas crevioricanis JCM 15906]|uniref:Uncharacterized protein n=1 Tax=Porphyromonas crevioricanis JCM 15906 TaxID=1305617 RepID=T1DRK3_9PORP|nr:hypothetical protein PORCRE_1005 [Porphyromonas crevioricanis JCM 15906]GAD06618.1 hypothetical protein PORCAN_216 [Porphyromonas crevioricanis JCM 13913]
MVSFNCLFETYTKVSSPLYLSLFRLLCVPAASFFMNNRGGG